MNDPTTGTTRPDRDGPSRPASPGEVPGRTTVTEVPHNAETELKALRETPTAPGAFYVRSNFPTPILDPSTWTLRLEAGDGTAAELTLARIQDLGPARTRLVTLECAGNGRTLLDPPAPGTPWTLGGTSTATFTGVPLSALMDQFPPPAATAEVVFTGADRGEKDGWGEIPFQRSLPLEAARAGTDGPLLAWAMNGEPLRAEHGAPLRLVVPGWYAVASVKWLAGIRYLDQPFQGCFQTDRYRYLRPGRDPEPVRRMRVRSLVLDPEAGQVIPAGRRRISGTAWSGHGEIVGVRVSVDGGARWHDARVEPAPAPFTPSRWSVEVALAPGEHEVMARARDAAGQEQPLTQWWNELGYGNNQVHRVPVVVRD